MQSDKAWCSSISHWVTCRLGLAARMCIDQTPENLPRCILGFCVIKRNAMLSGQRIILIIVMNVAAVLTAFGALYSDLDL